MTAQTPSRRSAADRPRPAEPIERWLLRGKRAAVCFSIDDVHPARSSDAYEAGGDLGEGVLGHVEWLLSRHPALRVTLFTTADWREISPVPTRRILTAIPGLRERVYLASRWPRGTMRLDRHPEFVAYLEDLPRTEVALHGLSHCHTGRRVAVEFQNQGRAEFAAILREIIGVFETAGLHWVPGLCPPGWNAPPPLLDAMCELHLSFIASARDIFTPIREGAVTNMSGLKGMSLIYPERVAGGRLVHFTSNFHATSPIDRALAIIERGGLLAIKAHIVKNACGHIAYDGLDQLYRNYLDVLFSTLEQRFGDELWWTSMGDLAASLDRRQS